MGPIKQTLETTLPDKCQRCPVRAQGAPFCWKDIQLQMACLGQSTLLGSLGRFENLYHQGDPATGWWVVRRGRVLEYILDVAGREQTIRLVTPGGIAGICGLGPQGEHWAGAKAGRSGAEVCFVPREQGLRMMAENPALGYCLLSGMAEEVRRAYQRLHGIATLPARACIARSLLTAIEPAPDGRPMVDMTRQEIAGMVGVALETVVRTLAEFRDQGLICTPGHGHIEILDTCRLHALSDASDDNPGCRRAERSSRCAKLHNGVCT